VKPEAAASGAAGPSGDAAGASGVGRKLRARREALGVSLRQFARELNVSASFISQLETGKTQPSVATLYAICSALNMSIDDVFEGEPEAGGASASADDVVRETDRVQAVSESTSVSRASGGAASHSPIVAPSQRRRIVLDSGVTWERLSSTSHADFDFVFVRYDVGGSSNTDGRLIRHAGVECGYVLRGELEVTLGFETFRMSAGDAITYDSSTPHRLANVGDVPVEAIWFDEGGHNERR
jgi:transcriptional regulator with XRE-family HTH domain/mannose-6-phosphate isomerase-like protein (cupin superfamily)